MSIILKVLYSNALNCLKHVLTVDCCLGANNWNISYFRAVIKKWFNHFLKFPKGPVALMLDHYRFCLGFCLMIISLSIFLCSLFLFLLPRLFPAFVGSWLSFKTRIFCKVMNMLCLLKKWKKQVNFLFDYFFGLLWFSFLIFYLIMISIHIF